MLFLSVELLVDLAIAPSVWGESIGIIIIENAIEIGSINMSSIAYGTSETSVHFFTSLSLRTKQCLTFLYLSSAELFFQGFSLGIRDFQACQN